MWIVQVLLSKILPPPPLFLPKNSNNSYQLRNGQNMCILEMYTTSPLPGLNYKILGNASCRKGQLYISHQMLGLLKTVRRGKRWPPHKNPSHITIKNKKIRDRRGTFHSQWSQMWWDMTIVVIDLNPHWTDRERKSKEKFWMHRFK